MIPLDDRAIIALIGGGIILLNIGIIYALLTGSAQEQLNIVGRIFKKARQPWSDEDEALGDLRKRVERLTAPEDPAGKPDE